MVSKEKLIGEYLDLNKFDDDYYVSTQEVVHNIFPEEYKVATAIYGSYQGEAGSVWEIEGDYIAINDYFGSCSHCDKFIGVNSEEEFERLIKTLVSNSHIESTKEDMISYLNEAPDDASSYDFRRLGPLLVNEFE